MSDRATTLTGGYPMDQPEKTFQNEFEAMLRKAQAQPGVADLMEFMESRQETVEAYLAFNKAMTPRAIGGTSYQTG